ncbi:FAD:protein FMN transferase [Phaeovulum vinaykumarii]|uniref:FAD:protein FMN transferase n=1 Tax=Phaeovulum vinaykumarii TaxID=407234 RepID=A0A1N7M7R8_9RHOB|nr:thiamine biosynthesis lipoprotein [Phaeovulum vinaykumarii]SOC11203.1 thiamine biosynthesis lipoprotein [Phaeovulum vinaykumarii]
MIPRRPLLRLALVVLVAAGLVAGVRALRPVPDTRETLYLFGTLVEVEIHGTPEAEARAAIADVGAHLQTIHRDWHAWRPGLLEDLNAAIAAGRPFTVDDALARVLRQGRDLSCASGGLFDPAIGALVEAWGFHADTPPEGDPPPAATIAALVARHPRMTDLRIDGNVVRSTNPAVQLDLGAYAKGAALDLAAADLRAAGVSDAVLNAGGGVQVIGQHGARPWRVAIRDPFQWGVVAALSLRPGEALHTSGNYERFLEAGGVRFSHILDPRKGQPVQGIVSVSVLDTNGARADAAATALGVAGAQDWPAVAAAMGVGAVLVISDDGTMRATPAMRARLEPVSGGFPGPIEVMPLPEGVSPPACPPDPAPAPAPAPTPSP